MTQWQHSSPETHTHVSASEIWLGNGGTLIREVCLGTVLQTRCVTQGWKQVAASNVCCMLSFCTPGTNRLAHLLLTRSSFGTLCV